MKFFIKTKKAFGKANVFFEVNKRTPKIKAQFNTFVSVDIVQWNRAHESASNLAKYMSTTEGAKAMETLHAIENVVNDLFSSGSINGMEDKAQIQEAVSDITFSEERAKRAEELARKEAEQKAEAEREANKYRNILLFYDWYAEGITSGEIRTGGDKYRTMTQKSWKNFGRHLKIFMKKRTERTFDEITPMFKECFVSYLNRKGLMTGTISLYVSKFRALCKASAKYGYNNNAVSLTGWETKKATKDDKKAEIYLTENELQKLYEMPLAGNKKIVRDMFFIGTCIAQRFGDYSRINKKMLSIIDNVYFLMFEQEKTGREMVIPIIDERVLAILKRYNYTFPNISLARFNLLLRSIVKDLSKTVSSLNEKIETAPTATDKRTEKAKWELVSSHTARRSAVTNMTKRGELSKREMMAMTGHSTEKIFEDYIKLGTMEQAKRIADKLEKSKEEKAVANIG